MSNFFFFLFLQLNQLFDILTNEQDCLFYLVIKTLIKFYFLDAILIVVLSMSLYTAYIFLPQHIIAMLAHFGVIATHGTASY